MMVFQYDFVIYTFNRQNLYTFSNFYLDFNSGVFESAEKPFGSVSEKLNVCNVVCESIWIGF